MENALVNVLGFSAALFTNTSMYPLANKVRIKIKTKEYNRLDSISFHTHLLLEIGCILWVIYAYMTATWPIFLGASCSLVPNSYIIIVVWYHYPLIYNRNTDVNMQITIGDESPNDDDITQVITASGINVYD